MDKRYTSRGICTATGRLGTASLATGRATQGHTGHTTLGSRFFSLPLNTSFWLCSQRPRVSTQAAHGVLECKQSHSVKSPMQPMQASPSGLLAGRALTRAFPLFFGGGYSLSPPPAEDVVTSRDGCPISYESGVRRRRGPGGGPSFCLGGGAHHCRGCCSRGHLPLTNALFSGRLHLG